MYEEGEMPICYVMSMKNLGIFLGGFIPIGMDCVLDLVRER